MKFSSSSASAVVALAGAASAQLTPQSGPNEAAIVSALRSVVPTSVVLQAESDPVGAFSEISSGGPSYLRSLPPNIVASITDPNFRQTALAFASPAVLTQTGAVPSYAVTPAGDSRIISVLRTAVPSSIIDLAATNSGSAFSQISSEFTASRGPSYVAAMPADVLSSVTNPSFRATNSIFMTPALLTQVATVATNKPSSSSGSAMPGSGSMSGSGSMMTTAPMSSSAPAAASGASTSAGFTGAAAAQPVPTGVLAGGAAIAAGLVGIIAL